MGKEIIQVIEVIANERSIEHTTIIEALELSLEETSKRELGAKNADIRVVIDRHLGEYQTFRTWHVVADNYPEGVELPVSEHSADEEAPEPLEFKPNYHITLSDALKQKRDIAVGETIEKVIDNSEFGRISIQVAKNIISKKIYEAERDRIYKEYKGKEGQLVSGTVKKFIKEGVLIDLGNKAEAILPRNQTIGREPLQRESRIKAVVTEIIEDQRGAQIKVSRTHPDMLLRLLELEIPEVLDQIIKIRSISREPGFRSKIAVSTNDNRIDPVGACVGMRGARIQAVIDELNGERIDVVEWDEDPAQLVMNLLKPAQIEFVSVDEVLNSMDVAVQEESLAMAIGRNGQNVRLASQMTGWKVNILSVEEANKKQNDVKQEWIDLFTSKLGVNKDIAEVLGQEGFVTLDEISRAKVEELANIDGFDTKLANELIERADFQLLMMVSEGTTVLPQESLLKLPSMSNQLAHKLARIGISERQDLADQGAIDLVEDFKDQLHEELNQKLAKDLIMEARGLK